MSVYSHVATSAERKAKRDELLAIKDGFLEGLPKVELHVHIEGTMTPDLRWKLAQRNGIDLKVQRTGQVFNTLAQLESSYASIFADSREDNASAFTNKYFNFFDAYYGGFDVLRTRQDYYELAMNYCERAAAMNVRYCEIFFDPQGHTRRGVEWETFMEGFRDAQAAAEASFNVRVKWIMCILRDLSEESAMEHYKASLPYKDMIIGIGLDSVEFERPPSLFEDVFRCARADGFRLTCHCDVGVQNTHEHIRQVACEVGTSGAERVDHGVNAAEKPELMDMIKKNGLGMTICPWAYYTHEPVSTIFSRIKTLYQAGINISIASDDPAYMEDCWILHNMLLIKDQCGFTNKDMAQMVINAVEMCWATEETKSAILEEIRQYIIALEE